MSKLKTGNLILFLLPALLLNACSSPLQTSSITEENTQSATAEREEKNEKDSKEEKEQKDQKPDQTGKEKEGQSEKEDGKETADSNEEAAHQGKQAEKDEPPLPTGLGSVVLAELGVLDEVPLCFGSRGWIVKQNGLYGFIRSDGQWIVEPSYTDLVYLPAADGSEGYGYLYNGEFDWQNDARLPKDHCSSDWDEPAGLGFARSGSIFLSESGQLVYRNVAGQPVSKEEWMGAARNFSTIYPDGTGEEELEFSSHSIYIPELRLISEALPADLELSYEHYRSRQMIPTLFNRDLGRTIILPSSTGVSLVSLEQKQGLTGFESLDFTDAFTFTGRHAGYFYSISDNLELEYSAAIEDGGSKIGEAVPVQIDGVWKIVSLGYLEENVPAEAWEPELIEDPFAEFVPSI